MHNSEPVPGQWCVITDYYGSVGVRFFGTEAEATKYADSLGESLRLVPSKPIATLRVLKVTRTDAINDS